MLYRAKRPHLLTIRPDKEVSGKNAAESIHIRGNPDAPVTLEEFGDFQCPPCSNAAVFIDQLVKEYHPNLKLVFRNLPLPVHQHDWKADPFQRLGIDAVGSVGAAPRTSSSSSDSTSGVPIPLALDCPSSGVTSSGILQYLPSAGLNVLFVIKTLGAGLEAAEAQVLLDDLVGLTVLDGLALVEP